MKFQILVVSFLLIFASWLVAEAEKGARDRMQLEFFWGSPNSPLMNADFQTGYVIIPEWLGERLDWGGGPFFRVLEIDFRLDNIRTAHDFLPYTVFKDVRTIRLDTLPSQEKDIIAFKKFPALEQIYVARLDRNMELKQIAKMLPNIEIVPGQ